MNDHNKVEQVAAAIEASADPRQVRRACAWGCVCFPAIKPTMGCWDTVGNMNQSKPPSRRAARL